MSFVWWIILNANYTVLIGFEDDHTAETTAHVVGSNHRYQSPYSSTSQSVANSLHRGVIEGKGDDEESHHTTRQHLNLQHQPNQHQSHHAQQTLQHQQQRRASVKRMMPATPTTGGISHAIGSSTTVAHHQHKQQLQQQQPSPSSPQGQQQQQHSYLATKRSPSLTSVRLVASSAATVSNSNACGLHNHTTVAATSIERADATGKGFSVDKINKMCCCLPGIEAVSRTIGPVYIHKSMT